MAAQDAQMKNAAAEANASNALGANEFNAGQSLTSQQANIQNALAQEGLTLNASGQLVALSNNSLGLATSQAGILGDVGSAQQEQQQNELNAAYQAWMNGNQLTEAQQSMLNTALGMFPTEQTVNGQSSTQYNTGIGGILGGIGSLGMGIAGMSMGLPGLESIGAGLFGSTSAYGPTVVGNAEYY